jgi:hypothetical protein
MPVKCWPQWSRPVIGRVTVAGLVGDAVQELAAMEPADDRPVTWCTRLRARGVRPSGMKVPKPLQWSRPLNGRMTPKSVSSSTS